MKTDMLLQRDNASYFDSFRYKKHWTITELLKTSKHEFDDDT